MQFQNENVEIRKRFHLPALTFCRMHEIQVNLTYPLFVFREFEAWYQIAFSIYRVFFIYCQVFLNPFFVYSLVLDMSALNLNFSLQSVNLLCLYDIV